MLRSVCKLYVISIIHSQSQSDTNSEGIELYSISNNNKTQET